MGEVFGQILHGNVAFLRNKGPFSFPMQDTLISLTSFALLFISAMKNATFQITPDVIKESETIQLGQDLKLSCHVDAVPQEKVVYSWYKNGKPARFSDRLLITRNDPELPPVTCSLEIIDLRFSDYGTYLCVATFQGAPIPDLSVEVNISSETGESLSGRWRLQRSVWLPHSPMPLAFWTNLTCMS